VFAKDSQRASEKSSAMDSLAPRKGSMVEMICNDGMLRVGSAPDEPAAINGTSPSDPPWNRWTGNVVRSGSTVRNSSHQEYRELQMSTANLNLSHGMTSDSEMALSSTAMFAPYAPYGGVAEVCDV
jgi:hypothetical protein